MKPRMTSPIRMKRNTSPMIGFRLEDPFFAELVRRAGALGISRNILARSLVIEALGEREGMKQTALAVLQALTGLREDLALSVEALLSSAGQVEEKEARAWIKDNLNAD